MNGRATRKLRIYGSEYVQFTEDVTCCIEEVHPRLSARAGLTPYQCQRKRGYGPDKLYCRQHAKILKKRNR